MRILVLTSSFPRHLDDIAGRFVMEHALELQKAGHAVRVMAWADGTQSTFEHAELHVTWVEHLAQDKRLFFGDGAPENLESDPMRALWALPAMVQMTRAAWEPASEADLIIGHWLVPSGALARALGKLLNKPSVVIGHSGGVHALARLPRPLGQALARLCVAGPTTLTSEPLKAKLAALTAVKHVRVLPMGFHPAKTQEAPKRRFEAVTMGRLVPLKNTELAIQAVMLSQSCTHLHILGDGPERARLEALADPDRVTFHGVVRGEAKAQILARCRLSLFPSIIKNGRHEGLPVSLLECCHAGAVPIIGQIPGAEDLLWSDLQHPAMTTVEWAKSIDVLIRIDAAEEARRRAEPYTWGVLGPTWAEWINTSIRGFS